MKFVDGFFTWILSIQNLLEKIEGWYRSRRKYVPWVYMSTFMIGVVLILLKLVMLGELVIISGVVFAGVDNIIGWKHSVRRWLKLCVVYNLFFSLVLTEIVQGMVKGAIADIVFVIIYLLVWVFLSLISIFTIGTYLVSMALKNKPASSNYLLYFQTDEAFELALANKDALAWEFFWIMGLEMLETAFLSLLPVIGVSALCIIMIKIKGYWVEKNRTPEPEKKIGYSEEATDTY